ncbi:methionine ABC transporter ATP-binding protein [Methylopila turkensis]|uniref:Methionine import ATP-binding protein MetN n=1 Tax=Methylopila turkensis TaxID=1437816 RepID=A0A9W6JMA8_9HYPH|nr:methionine ABC transporter ATP-binding protein [Methylopila turkensis]GLK80266.1 methionine import ATP-binding protein MetN [Methylopila turkensis]
MNAPMLAARLAAPVVPSAAVVRIKDVRLVYRAADGSDVSVLDGVNLEAARGEILAVIGRSGAGKSALLRLVEGRETPDSGAIELAGESPTIGVVARHGGLDAKRTLGENLAVRLQAAGHDAATIAREVDHALDLADLASARGRHPAQLSDGERRRAVFARALCGAPDVLLLDEPTAGLDPESARTLLSAVARASKERGATVLLASHDMTAVAAIAHRVAMLDGGRIVEEGPTTQVVARPKRSVTRRFAAAVSGAALPAFLSEKLSQDPTPRGKALLRLAFEGPAATRPVLTEVARELGFDLGIVAGSLGQLGGQPFGVLIVAAPSDEPYFTAACERLEDAGLGVEKLGFVA